MRGSGVRGEDPTTTHTYSAGGGTVHLVACRRDRKWPALGHRAKWEVKSQDRSESLPCARTGTTQDHLCQRFLALSGSATPPRRFRESPRPSLQKNAHIELKLQNQGTTPGLLGETLVWMQMVGHQFSTCGEQGMKAV